MPPLATSAISPLYIYTFLLCFYLFIFPPAREYSRNIEQATNRHMSKKHAKKRASAMLTACVPLCPPHLVGKCARKSWLFLFLPLNFS